VCHFEAEATFADGDRRGRIVVTLRGQVERPPVPLSLRPWAG
jgi:hypothetical protein